MTLQSCTSLLCPWDIPGKNIGVGKEKKKEYWSAISFSRESSQPRDQTQVSCIAGRFFTIWATREACQGHKFHSIMFFQKVEYNIVE